MKLIELNHVVVHDDLTYGVVTVKTWYGRTYQRSVGQASNGFWFFIDTGMYIPDHISSAMYRSYIARRKLSNLKSIPK